MRHLLSVAALLLAGAATALGQSPTSILSSPHNLSTGGPGRIRAANEAQVCIFCHTPHNASATQPLWNRRIPVEAYRVYSSNSLKSRPGQPTGTSKLCLSCHDGTIALGSVLSRGQPIVMAGGITTLPPGASNLGTDLSDDHPISFRYDAALLQKNLKLKDPRALTHAVHLDGNSEVQCTSCHNPHNNVFGRFLVIENRHSELCNTCHNLGRTDVAQHEVCDGCHKNHTAPSGPYLLTKVRVAETCTTCHGTGGQASNVAADLAKVSLHETHSSVSTPNPIPRSVSCGDCHEPHTMRRTTATAPALSGPLGEVSGVTLGGTATAAARFQYEVCFKCHGDQSAVPPAISRQIVQPNLRFKFHPTAPSFHPVEAPGKNSDVPSLLPGLNVSSLIYCTDCHNSDTSRLAGGSGPNGPHGSTYRPLLIARYETTDNTSESATAYALCYRCHQRNAILSGQQPFPSHKLHVADMHIPCSVCHDAHGASSTQANVRNNSHLINFDTTVVLPHPTTGQLTYTDLGRRHGSCTLSCHNSIHLNKSY